VRRLLDLLYGACAALAAVFLVAIAVLILAQIIGRQVGLIVPSATELAALCMAATTFLALAPTLRAGGHIRVGLFIGRLGRRPRRAVELWCLAVALFLVGYFAWYAADLAWSSYRRGRVTPGLLPVPLWPPQAAVAFGLIVLEVALLESMADILGGRPPASERAGGDTRVAAAPTRDPAHEE
jgi:TRAP-type C4-dicarboxylate transport system permease small subunit